MISIYKKTLRFAACLSWIAGTYSATAQITFEKHYATTFDQSGKDVIPTADGGYLITGTTENTTVNDLDVTVIKTNATGDILSTRVYGGSHVDFPNSITPTNDGNFFIIGATS